MDYRKMDEEALGLDRAGSGLQPQEGAGLEAVEAGEVIDLKALAQETGAGVAVVSETARIGGQVGRASVISELDGDGTADLQNPKVELMMQFLENTVKPEVLRRIEGRSAPMNTVGITNLVRAIVDQQTLTADQWEVVNHAEDLIRESVVAFPCVHINERYGKKVVIDLMARVGVTRSGKIFMHSYSEHGHAEDRSINEQRHKNSPIPAAEGAEVRISAIATGETSGLVDDDDPELDALGNLLRRIMRERFEELGLKWGYE